MDNIGSFNPTDRFKQKPTFGASKAGGPQQAQNNFGDTGSGDDATGGSGGVSPMQGMGDLARLKEQQPMPGGCLNCNA
jgi:hypothetical protein